MSGKTKPPLVLRKYTPFRLTIHVLRLIDEIARRRAMSRARVVEWALQEIAERDGITKGGAL
jgi:hypothetical protein